MATGKLRDVLSDREIFYNLLEVRVLTEQHRQTHRRNWPHNSLRASSRRRRRSSCLPILLPPRSD